MKIVSALFFILTIFSCKKENVNKEPYLSLDAIGLSILSEIKVNDTLKFRGTNNAHQQFKVFKIEKSVQTVQDCNWNTNACKTYYSFDQVRYFFIKIDSIAPSPFLYTMTLTMQLPSNIDEKNIPNDVKGKACIFGNAFINYNAIPPSNSPSYTSPYINYPDFYSTVSFTTFANSVKTYNEVVVIQSGNNLPYTNPVYGNVSTINEVWFDKKYGFVLFKDINGIVWNKIN